MKKIIIKLLTLLILAGSFYSCKKKDECSVPLPYNLCPHEEENKYFPKVIQGKAYLIIDSMPEQVSNKLREEFNSLPIYEVFLIFYNSKTDEAGMAGIMDYGRSILMTQSGSIRNFPDFAKDWDIPNGCMVDFEALKYGNCHECNPLSSLIATYDYVLTCLKRKKTIL